MKTANTVNRWYFSGFITYVTHHLMPALLSVDPHQTLRHVTAKKQKSSRVSDLIFATCGSLVFYIWRLACTDSRVAQMQRSPRWGDYALSFLDKISTVYFKYLILLVSFFFLTFEAFSPMAGWGVGRGVCLYGPLSWQTCHMGGGC